ncbi:hypothetical protein JCM3766R1_002665 [Sporobolomyces carnicolor]
MNRIRSPIPELYRSQASTLSTSASAPDLRKFHRTSVSIQPDEDPFSPTTHEVAAAEAAQADSDDDWARVSEDSIGFNELGEAEGGLGGQDSMRRIGRKPSFLKDLWDRRLSRSSSVSSLQSVKHTISNPILKTDPPRVGALRSRASLVPISHVNGNPISIKEEDDIQTDSDQRGTRGLSELGGPLGADSASLGTTKPRDPSGAPPSEVRGGPPTNSRKALAVLLGAGAMPKDQAARSSLSNVVETAPRQVAAFAAQPSAQFADAEEPSSAGTPSLCSSTTDQSITRSLAANDASTFLSATQHQNLVREDSETIPEALSTLAASSPPSSTPAAGPTLSTGSSSGHRRTSVVRFGTDVKESREGRRALTARASEPNLRRPLSDIFARSIRTASTEKASSLKRFRSSENLRPVSSATLPKVSSTPVPITLSKPVASLYLVAGLNKDPSRWSRSTCSPCADDRGCVDTVDLDHTLWKPEVLDRRTSRSDKLVKLGTEDAERVETQAVKLAFNEDIRIVLSESQPAATTTFFSFSIPTSSLQSSTSSSSLVSSGYDEISRHF